MTASAGTPVEGLPEWLSPLVERVQSAKASDFVRYARPEQGGRRSAVLILLAEGPEVLLLERAATLRRHAGQPAFPGGVADEGEHDPVVTALREAEEEVGLHRDSVRVTSQLPPIWIPVTDYVVTPVLAWWHSPHPVGPVDPAEVARVARVPIAELADPANRFRVRHASGWMGPAFGVEGMVVWGFTATVLSTLLDFAGWALPWDKGQIRDL
ncbi:NUDIX hydrolase [Longispora albida]|uniref:NUDIX hydrolase n=1 Tax=Longispora albida TaxID=203523 RepID=UPI000379308B